MSTTHFDVSVAGSRVPAARVRLAATFLSRLRGLLGEDALAEGEGLWLVPGGSIHTLGMRCSIDAIFLDADYRVLKVRSPLLPGGWALAPWRTASVLELGAGGAGRAGITPGILLHINACSETSLHLASSHGR